MKVGSTGLLFLFMLDISSLNKKHELQFLIYEKRIPWHFGDFLVTFLSSSSQRPAGFEENVALVKFSLCSNPFYSFGVCFAWTSQEVSKWLVSGL